MKLLRNNKIYVKYNKMSLITKASLWFLICSFIQKGINIIVTPIFTRMMTTTEFGKYNVFTSWEYILNIFVSLCLSAGVYQQGLVKYEDDMKKFSSSMQGLTLTLVIISSIIYFIFRKIINSFLGFDTIYMFSMFFIIWTNNVFAFWSNEQKVQFQYKKLIVLTVCISIATPLLSIFLMKLMIDKVYARILSSIIVAILFYTILFWAQMKRGKTFYNKKYWKYAILYNVPLVPHYLSQVILSSSDRIMIERLVDSNAAGIYSLAYSIALIMTLFNNSIMQTLSPWMYKKIKEKKIKDISKIGYASLIAIALVNLLLIMVAPEAISIFAPNNYHEAMYVIPPVAMSVFFMYTYDLFAKFEFYYEKTKLIATATVIGALVNLILNYIFIKSIGYIAAAYTTLLCYILYSIFHYFAMVRTCNEKLNGEKPYNFKILLAISLTFAILGFSLMIFYNSFIVRYIFIALTLFICIIYRKKIIKLIKEIL